MADFEDNATLDTGAKQKEVAVYCMVGAPSKHIERCGTRPGNQGLINHVRGALLVIVHAADDISP
jgi:hypothetical protein